MTALGRESAHGLPEFGFHARAHARSATAAVFAMLVALFYVFGNVATLAQTNQPVKPAATGAVAAATVANVPPPPLPVDVAFPMTVVIDKAQPAVIQLKIDVQPGHYVYQDRFEFLRDGEPMYTFEQVKQPQKSQPTSKKDPQFGKVWVYEAPVSLNVGTAPRAPSKFTVVYQGCSELAGVCYPPTKRTFELKEAGVAISANEVAKPGLGHLFKKQASQ